MFLREEIIFPCSLFYWEFLPLDEVLINWSFHSFLILLSMIVYVSNINFPSSSIYGKIVWTVIFSPIAFLGRKCRRLDVHMKLDIIPIYNPYFLSITMPCRDHRTLVLICCPSFASLGISVYLVVASKIPNLPLQIPFHYDVDLLIFIPMLCYNQVIL